jgi:hypothetical protein
LQLAHDRHGSSLPATEIDVRDLEPSASALAAVLPWLTELDRAALIGLAFADRDVDKARAGWAHFLHLAGPEHPFRAHAQERIRRLGGGAP